MSSGSARNIAVIDIGKTNAKLVLFDLARGREVASLKTENHVLSGPPYRHFDVDHLWRFIVDGLKKLAKDHHVDAISITTHASAAALLDANGTRVLPILDYEDDALDAVAEEYAKARPDFSETGSPRLPGGLNLGVQMFWHSRAFPDAFAKVHSILLYPQYWAYRLCGVAAAEATFLGCHTDMWNPYVGNYSSLVDKEDWRKLMPPLRRAADVLGPITPEIAALTGLPPTTPVHCGIHDSNASLFPHLVAMKPPFAVVSTGTWVINMAIGGKKVTLDPKRDTLINVNALGNPVPSSRFMGGREHQLIMKQGAVLGESESDVDEVLRHGIMLLPAVVDDCGPFRGRETRWENDQGISGTQRHAALSFYLALMTATCLELIGADGPILVEGPFSANESFLKMLGAATERPIVTGQVSETGTALGAAMLAGSTTARSEPASEKRGSITMQSYAQRWRAATASSA